MFEDKKENYQKPKEKNPVIEAARKESLEKYFLSSGYTLQKYGSEIYIKEIQGLCINPTKGSWYSHYESKGGYNSIDCLTEILGKDFKTAVQELTGQDLTTKHSYTQIQNENLEQKQNFYEQKNKELEMPQQGENMRRVFAYFIQERKIPAEIVSEFAKSGLLYQSTGEVEVNFNGIQNTLKVANAVFKHVDESGKIVGGEVQGINTNKRYKGVAKGTKDSVFQFRPDGKDTAPKKAYLFESAIDLMSFYSFCDKSQLKDTVLISMAGLKPTIPKQLQEKGVVVLSCVDNDERGKKFEKDNGFKRAGSLLERENVKDWNELLVKRAVGGVSKNANAITAEKKPFFSFTQRKI